MSQSEGKSAKGTIAAPVVPYRIGIGYDLHRLVNGRRLVLGGIEVPHTHGLLGHSDADVVLHAISDALLGAAGLPDIGELYPDTDARYEDADSRKLLSDVVQRVAHKGYRVGNIDLCIRADVPKISPHKLRMRESIAALLGIEADSVNVKGKTTEGVGPHEAIECTAVALLIKNGV